MATHRPRHPETSQRSPGAGLTLRDRSDSRLMRRIRLTYWAAAQSSAIAAYAAQNLCYDASFKWRQAASGSSDAVLALSRPADAAIFAPLKTLFCRIECTSVMSGLGGAPAALLGVGAGRCRRRTGRGSGRCGGTAGPRSGRPGRGGVGPFAWVPADLGYGDRQASVWRALSIPSGRQRQGDLTPCHF